MAMKELFKRMNFFKGFFTQAEDWQQSEDYHIEKRKLHNRFFHTPGIVFGCLDNLQVSASRDGTTLNIAPGFAVDGEGRELYLPKQEQVTLIPQNYRPPATVYVVIRYHEEKVDLRPNEANPEYSNYAFIQEGPTLEITADEPDNIEVIELARIKLSKDASRIKDAKDTGSPGSDEIDMTHIKEAGVKIGVLTLENIGEVVREGEISIISDKEPIPMEDDTNVLIEKVKGKLAHRFYQVSAYPEEEARISWRLESNFNNNAVEYRLFLKNFSAKEVKVFYKIYRLN